MLDINVRKLVSHCANQYDTTVYVVGHTTCLYNIQKELKKMEAEDKKATENYDSPIPGSSGSSYAESDAMSLSENGYTVAHAPDAEAAYLVSSLMEMQSRRENMLHKKDANEPNGEFSFPVPSVNFESTQKENLKPGDINLDDIGSLLRALHRTK